MNDDEPEESRDDRGLRLARVNPVGILELPAGGSGERRPASRGARLAALVLLALFAFVTVATTVASLGSYCLTSDGSDVRHLPGAQAGAHRP